MVKAVLSDIDGTLLQSNWLHAAAWKDAFAAAGVEVDLEEVRRQIGKGGDELIPVYLPWWKKDVLAEPLKTYRRFVFRQDYLKQVTPFPHVRELFEKMKEAGIRIALASSCDKAELEVYKSLAKITDLVEESSSADDAERAKPHPDIFAATLKKLGLKASEVLALGDTPYDVEAAGKIGIWTVAVTTGGWSVPELFEAGAIEVYRDVGELLDKLPQSAFLRESYGAL